MKKWIKYTLVTLGIFIFVEIQVSMAMVSKQHQEFLKLFFWEFPKEVFKLLVSYI